MTPFWFFRITRLLLTEGKKGKSPKKQDCVPEKSNKGKTLFLLFLKLLLMFNSQSPEHEQINEDRKDQQN